jgi:hypothetical protein
LGLLCSIALSATTKQFPQLKSSQEAEPTKHAASYAAAPAFYAHCLSAWKNARTKLISAQSAGLRYIYKEKFLLYLGRIQIIPALLKEKQSSASVCVIL